MRFILLLQFAVLFAASSAVAQPPLRILQDNYPRAYFFRKSEGFAANQGVTFQRWDDAFSRLMGIEGKVLEEEVPGRSLRNIEFFTRFKQAHPEQLVLLHFNGNARDPRWQREPFFAGHWIYFNGARITRDVPAAAGEMEIHVDNARLFRTDMGRYRDCNEDVGLCLLDADGRPNWHESEQVQLLSVDVARGTIRVRRGCFGTRPRRFPAGAAYAAAHVTEGPWGKNSNLLWLYNFATCCPRDRQGRTCGQVHCHDLAARFLPGGELAHFDGVQFDVLHHHVGRGRGARAADCDADGQPDGGLIDGVNQYGVGVWQFCRQLREQLGDDRIIQADGMSIGSQRAVGILNGIESEGWPTLRDWEIRDWSGGLNRHFYWAAHAREPVLNYINHKFTAPGERPGQRVQPEVSYGIHRLVFAAATFTDAAICYSFTPPRDRPGELIGVWDELRKGVENETGWLGRPTGPAVRMALQTPDVLRGEGAECLSIELDERSGQTQMRIDDVPCDGPDLLVALTMHGRPRAGYPNSMPRLAWLGIAPPRGGDATAFGPGDQPPSTAPQRFMTWCGPTPFTSYFYFSRVNSPTVDLLITVEGREPVTVTSLSAHHHADVIYRPFERGLALANPSPRPFTFDLREITPDRSWRRLRGSPTQDPAANNGAAVGPILTLGEREGLFLASP